MENPKPIVSTPVAILIGSVVIGAGLFFGLRDRQAEPVAPAASTAPAPSAPSVSPPTEQGTGAPPPAPAPSTAGLPDAKVIELATAEIEKHRKLLVEKCWTASTAPMPEPPVARLVLNFTFDPAGKTIARGMVEDRRAHRSGVSSCVSQQLPDITIAAPGRSAHVEVPISLP
jgi:hypothetical protein